MKSRSQRYSERVFSEVQAFVEDKGEENKIAKKYKALCKGAGGMLRTVGLIQFMTFLASRREKEVQHGALLDQIREEIAGLSILQSENEADFLKKIREMELPQYMRTTSVVLQLLQWHKRVSEILIPGTAEEGE